MLKKSLLSLSLMAMLAGKPVHEISPVLPSATYLLPADMMFEKENNLVSHLFTEAHLGEVGLGKEVLDLAIKGYKKLLLNNKLNNDSIITIIDYSKPSTEKRLYIIDVKHNELLHYTHVAHGRNSGLTYAKQFSNTESSNKSSLGFFVTRNTYNGQNGYSLRLDGVEKNINDKAFKRAIVIHGADYVNNKFLNNNGTLGRSFGCPSLPTAVNKDIINTIKDGTCLFIYAPDNNYLKKSSVLNG